MSTSRVVIAWLVALALLGPSAALAEPQRAADPVSDSKRRLLDVPFVPQSEALCGGASAAMVFRYWRDLPAHAEDFASLVDGSAEGIKLGDLARAIRERGWRAFPFAGTPAAVQEHLVQGRPVIALIEDRPGRHHYVVVVAWTRDRIIFHDPARGPFRVIADEAFDAAWKVTNRTTLLILPAETRDEAMPTVTSAPAGGSRSHNCAQIVEEAVQTARRGDLESAEALLSLADRACPLSSAAPRELAGIRFMQRRWADVITLAERAVARDPSDAHAWQLLATARFLGGDADGALRAWNSRNEPRIDLARVEGLDRTHYQVVSDLLNLPSQSLLTVNQLERAKRRLAELPALQMSRVSYSPRASGLATIDVAVVERPLLPRTWLAASAAGLRAATAREMRLEMASPTGNGELWIGKWRWWPNRPRIGLSVAMPTLAGWSGVWRFDADWERETYGFAEGSRRNDRRRAAVTFGDWLSGDVRWELTGAFENSTESGRHVSAGAAIERRLFDDHLAVRLDGSVAPFAGSAARFGSAGISSAWRVDVPRGLSLAARTGVQTVTARTPLAFWPAADTGHVRDALLRAHPLLHDGTIRATRLGRVLAHSTIELQRNLASLPLARLRWAIFVDAAKQSSMLTGDPTAHIDAGAGFRADLPGAPGTFRVDLARGIRDGNVVLSAAWQPNWPGW
jgi:hypothetical protein